jgi:tRNA-dihydrouridine synthase A
MARAVSIPVTVKTRIGIDHQDSYEELTRFVGLVAAGGCQTFIVHARKAWLAGLSPRENREIPPLRYDLVWRLKQDFPALKIVLNGGIRTLDQVCHHLQKVDGVMIGREAYHHPYMLANADVLIFGDPTGRPRSRQALVEAFIPYAERQLAKGIALHHLTRPLSGLFRDQAGARRWRRLLSEHAGRSGDGVAVLQEALAQVATSRPLAAFAE